MPARTTTLAASRRVLMIALLALIATLGIAASGAGTVSAAPIYPTYTGHAYVRSAPVYTRCYYEATCRVYATTYQWTGIGWRPIALPRRTQVYAYPLSVYWHWAWTQRTGWVAISTAELSDTIY